MGRLQWVSVDLLTGSLLADFTELSFSGPLKKTIGRYETANCELAVGAGGRAAPPEGWLRATMPGAAALIALDPSTSLPLWGGVVLQRQRGEGDTITLGLATGEAYFDRRYVGTVTYGSQSPNSIAADLVTRYVAGSSNGRAGIPIRVQYTAGSSTMSTIYYDYNDVTVYSALTSLMGLLNGPEWSLEWEWQHNPERITPVLYIGGTGGSNRVGTSAPPGLSPNAQFTMPGGVRSFQLSEDYTSGKGANVVTATSSGNGIARPTSGPQVMAGAIMPAFEYRYSPTQNLLVSLTLQQYAQQALAVIGSGTVSLTLSADLGSAPALGQDWRVGDDIGYQIGGPDQYGHDTVPGFPGGINGTARTIGFELTDEDTPTLSPILYQPTIYTGA